MSNYSVPDECLNKARFLMSAESETVTDFLIVSLQVGFTLVFDDYSLRNCT
jgi:hypothetical protein